MDCLNLGVLQIFNHSFTVRAHRAPAIRFCKQVVRSYTASLGAHCYKFSTPQLAHRHGRVSYTERRRKHASLYLYIYIYGFRHSCVHMHAHGQSYQIKNIMMAASVLSILFWRSHFGTIEAGKVYLLSCSRPLHINDNLLYK